MRKVKTVPPPAKPERPRDPWFDRIFDGSIWQLTRDDWDQERGGRYKTQRSASSAIAEAAKARGVSVTVSIRGEAIYVEPSRNGTS